VAVRGSWHRTALAMEERKKRSSPRRRRGAGHALGRRERISRPAVPGPAFTCCTAGPPPCTRKTACHGLAGHVAGRGEHRAAGARGVLKTRRSKVNRWPLVEAGTTVEVPARGAWDLVTWRRQWQTPWLPAPSAKSRQKALRPPPVDLGERPQKTAVQGTDGGYSSHRSQDHPSSQDVSTTLPDRK